MRIASFLDIHSNYHALLAVLEKIEEDEVDLTLCAGDLVGYGPDPNEVVMEIKRRGIPTVQGNYDEGVGFDLDDCGCAYKTRVEKETGDKSLFWTQGKVTEGNKAFLRRLPNQMIWDRENTRVLLVHGSPRRINEYIYEDRPENSINRMLARAP